MSLNIKDQRTHELVRRLAEATGETLTEAVRIAAQERLRRWKHAQRGRSGVGQALGRDCPTLCRFADAPERTEDDILGYNERGLPD